MGHPVLDLLNSLCLCTTEVEKDTTAAQDLEKRANPWTEGPAQEECEEWKRILGSKTERLEKSPPQRLAKEELRIHWKTSQEKIIRPLVKL